MSKLYHLIMKDIKPTTSFCSKEAYNDGDSTNKMRQAMLNFDLTRLR